MLFRVACHQLKSNFKCKCNLFLIERLKKVNVNSVTWFHSLICFYLQSSQAYQTIKHTVW